MKRTLFTALLLPLLLVVAAQTKVEKRYPIKPGQQLELRFDFPELIKISTWDEKEVAITATVRINEGENDDAFVLLDEQDSHKLSVRNEIKDLKNLPKMYTVVRSGVKTTFHTQKDYEDYLEKNGKTGHSITSEGVDIKVTIEVKVPANTTTNVNAQYGLVEIKNFNASITANATYGGVDAFITESRTGKLTATTHYGKMFTNLDLRLTEKEEKNFFSSITAEPGSGYTYNLKSTYGKLYLRKQQ